MEKKINWQWIQKKLEKDSLYFEWVKYLGLVKNYIDNVALEESFALEMSENPAKPERRELPKIDITEGMIPASIFLDQINEVIDIVKVSFTLENEAEFSPERYYKLHLEDKIRAIINCYDEHDLPKTINYNDEDYNDEDHLLKTINYSSQAEIDAVGLAIMNLAINSYKSDFPSIFLNLSRIFDQIVENVHPTAAKEILELIKGLEVKNARTTSRMCFENVIQASFKLDDDQEKRMDEHLELTRKTEIASNSMLESAKKITVIKLLSHLYPSTNLASIPESQWQMTEYDIETIADLYLQLCPITKPLNTPCEDYLDVQNMFNLLLKAGDRQATTDYCKQILETYHSLIDKTTERTINNFCKAYNLEPEIFFFTNDNNPFYGSIRFAVISRIGAIIGFMKLYLDDSEDAIEHFVNRLYAEDAKPEEFNGDSNILVEAADRKNALFDFVFMAQIGVICGYLQLDQKSRALELLHSTLSRILSSSSKKEEASFFYFPLAKSFKWKAISIYTTLAETFDSLIKGQITCHQAKSTLLKDIVGYNFGE